MLGAISLKKKNMFIFKYFRDDILKMKYLSCFLKETMRYYTPVPIVSRQLDEPTILDGVEFPEGTVTALDMYSVHHNPDVWEHEWVRLLQNNLTSLCFCFQRRYIKDELFNLCL